MTKGSTIAQRVCNILWHIHVTLMAHFKAQLYCCR